MLKKFNLVGVIVGIVIIIFSVCIFSFDYESQIFAASSKDIQKEVISAPTYEADKSYGGDAYTGMQQASAQAANNLIPVFDALEENTNAIIQLNDNNNSIGDAETQYIECLLKITQSGIGFILLAIGLVVISKNVEFEIQFKKKEKQIQASEVSE